jgi:hypothetical protein
MGNKQNAGAKRAPKRGPSWAKRKKNSKNK